MALARFASLLAVGAESAFHRGGSMALLDNRTRSRND
jgi:hypothetical protein